MTNRRHLQCASCGTKVITRTAIGHGAYQEYAFPCPNCSVEIRFGLEINQIEINFEYTKLVNAIWLEHSEKFEGDFWQRDDAIKIVEVFDSETLVPIPKDRHQSAFLATAFLPKNFEKFRQHQSLRFHVALNIWQEVEKLLIHLGTKKWELFDKQAKEIDPEVSGFVDERDRLIFVIRALEMYGKFFRPETDGQEQMIRQRINLAESTSPKAVQDLLAFANAADKQHSLWAELLNLRKTWVRLFPSLSGIYNVFYWDGSKRSLDNYTLAEKRFDELKQFYVDCFETFCRISVFAAATECVIRTGCAGIQSAKTTLSLEEFDAVANGNKPDQLKDLVVADVFVPFIDSKLRNGIGHHSARYNIVVDSIEYSNQNKKGIQRMSVSYIRFCEKVVRLYGQLELVSIYVNWIKGRSHGLIGRIV